MTQNQYQAPQSMTETPLASIQKASPFFSPVGKIGRGRYFFQRFVSLAVAALLFIAAGGVFSELPDLNELVGGSILILAVVFYFYSTFAIMVKRLRDLNQSGLLSLLWFIPLISLGLAIYLLFFPGKKSTDQAKNNDNAAVIVIAVIVGLFVLIGILGILAAIAIPQYQNYTTRIQLTNAHAELSSLKVKTEQALIMGQYTDIDASFNAQSIGYKPSKYLENELRVEFNQADAGYGLIVGTLGNEASTAISGSDLILQRQSDETWNCFVVPFNESTFNEQYLPPGCTQTTYQ